MEIKKKKMCPWDMDAPLWQTGGRHMLDLKRGDKVQFNPIMLQTNYQINEKYTSRKVFYENVQHRNSINVSSNRKQTYDLPEKRRQMWGIKIKTLN